MVCIIQIINWSSIFCSPKKAIINFQTCFLQYEHVGRIDQGIWIICKRIQKRESYNMFGVHKNIRIPRAIDDIIFHEQQTLAYNHRVHGGTSCN